MFRRLMIPALATLLATAAPARAVCPEDAGEQLQAMAEGARAGTQTLAALGEAASASIKDCGEDRVVLSMIFEMFTAAGLTIEPPAPERFQAQLLAYRSVNRILRAGGGDFAPVAPVGWTVDDERNTYWDLMFAMSGDFLVYGAHGDLYMPGKLESLGCGLYPAEEAAALARQARGNLDGGELMARASYLGRACDTDERETSGWAARYFAEHAYARADDPQGYSGLTESDIRAGLGDFLDRHLEGSTDSWLFDEGEVSRLRAY